jgi:signal transduction histidine kinase
MAFGRFISSVLNGVPQPEGQITAVDGPQGPAVPGVSPAETAAITDDERTARALDGLRGSVRAAGRELPTVLTSQLRQIDDLLREVVATIEAQDASTEQRVLLAAMIGDYIPTPLRAFLALPDADRADDSQATVVFSRQLRLLEETIRDLLNQVRIGAIAELSTHGRFLADKFTEPDAGLVLGGR